jgi:hypothetical protein
VKISVLGIGMCVGATVFSGKQSIYIHVLFF